MALVRAFVVHVVVLTLSLANHVTAEGKQNPSGTSYEYSAEIDSDSHATATKDYNSHSTILAHEGDYQELECVEIAASPNTQAIWLKNGAQFEGEVVTYPSSMTYDAAFRSNLIIRTTHQSDNGIYTCIVFCETGKNSLKSFDLLVTAARSEDVTIDFMNQKSITAIIAVMITLIVLMAIATVLSYRTFCSSKINTETLSTKKLSLSSQHRFVFEMPKQKELPPMLPV